MTKYNNGEMEENDGEQERTRRSPGEKEAK